MKILMVCLGNICRSPLAQGILQTKITQKGLNWEIDSAGTGSWHIGENPDPRSISVARQHHVDISDQRARQVTSQDFAQFDLIFAMDTQNYENLTRIAPTDAARNKVRLVMEELYPNSKISVPDPYWDDNGFENVYQMLDKAFDHFLQKHLDHAGV